MGEMDDGIVAAANPFGIRSVAQVCFHDLD
jgi:hypothetical protein